MIALDTQITLSGVREAAARAWSWWTSELIATMPSPLRRYLVTARPELLVYLNSSEAAIFSVDEGREVRLAAVDLQANAANGDMVNTLPIVDPGRAPNVHLLISRALVLRRELDLPKAAESKLRQIVALDLDRQTPFMAEDVAFDVVVSGHHPQTGRIRAVLAVVKRGTIDKGLEICRRLGGRPVSATIGDPGGLASEFNLLPQSKLAVERERRTWRNPRYLFAAMISGLVAANVTLAFERLNERVNLLATELVKARKDTQETEKLRSQLELLQAQQQLLTDMQSQPQPLALLQELTHVLPDDTWLFQLQTENGSGKILGFSPSASNLIEKLDKSAQLANPKLKSTLMRPDRPGEERFEISFDLRGVNPK